MTSCTLAVAVEREAADAPAAELFLAGTISTREAIEHGAVVTPDGSEIWFTRAIGVWGEPARSAVIHVARRTPDGTYHEPVPAPFSTGFDGDPFPSPDGAWLYFVSDRPAP
ncbi:MAG: hypothetical protein R3244_07780, partial [Thermoanaerobaculia bacterium]|nr:hypothetical protein [Thermoanaerobaculia bacterium]